jgi:hypothetical protein
MAKDGSSPSFLSKILYARKSNGIFKACDCVLSALEKLVNNVVGLGDDLYAGPCRTLRCRMLESINNLKSLHPSNYDKAGGDIGGVASYLSSILNLIMTLNENACLDQRFDKDICKVRGMLKEEDISMDRVCTTVNGLIRILEKITRKATFASWVKSDIEAASDILGDLEMAKEYVEKVKSFDVHESLEAARAYIGFLMRTRRGVAEKLLFVESLRIQGFGVKRVCKRVHLSTKTYYKHWPELKRLLEKFELPPETLLEVALVLTDRRKPEYKPKLAKDLRKLSDEFKAFKRYCKRRFSLIEERNGSDAVDKWDERNDFDKLRILLTNIVPKSPPEQAEAIVAVVRQNALYQTNEGLQSLLTQSFGIDSRKAQMIANALFPQLLPIQRPLYYQHPYYYQYPY